MINLKELFGVTKRLLKKSDIEHRVPIDITEPSSYPEKNKIPPARDKDDRNVILDPESNNTDLQTPPIATAPEQLSGPGDRAPQSNKTDEDQVKKFQEDSRSDFRPFWLEFPKEDKLQKVYPLSPNEKNINLPKSVDPFGVREPSEPGYNIARLTVAQVEEICPVIAKKMEHLGIEFVEQDLFMDKYIGLCKKAALKGISISELLKDA